MRRYGSFREELGESLLLLLLLLLPSAAVDPLGLPPRVSVAARIAVKLERPPPPTFSHRMASVLNCEEKERE